MSEVISYLEEEEILHKAMERYNEYREEYSSPRTGEEKRRMINYILAPIIQNLSDWDIREKTAQAKLKDIQSIINEDRSRT